MEVLGASLVASEASIATVALRRIDPNVKGSIYDLLDRLNFRYVILEQILDSVLQSCR